MKKTLIYTLLACLTYSCSSTTKHGEDEKNVIRLKEALAHPVELNLSEIVDSLVYVPLETKPECYVREQATIFYSKPYWVSFPGTMFDMQGKFVANIGSLGQGPGEEINGWGYFVQYDESKDLFYTEGDKLIQFDNNFKFTGKELQITHRLDNGNVSVGLKCPYAFVRAGKYNVLVNYPDSVYWMDENLEVANKARIIPDSLYLSTPGGGLLVEYTFSTYKDTTLFFNCFTDELCSVTETGVHPRWKFDLEGEKADSRCFLNGLQKLFVEEMRKIIKSSGGNEEAMKRQAANSTLAKLVDGKKWIGKAFESDRYVILTWTNLLAFPEWRGGNKSYWAFYDKHTKKTLAVSKLINDIDGCTNIFPVQGIQDGVIMTSIWPFEAQEFVKKQKEAGKKVDPRLEEIASIVPFDHNPIMVLAYLKK